MVRRFALLAVVLAAVLRVWWLPLWGTFDTEVQKAWSARAAGSGLADIYGPPDREVLERARRGGGVPRTTFTWHGSEYFVDYPPGSLLALWAAGKLYGRFDPEMPNRPAFNAAINLAPLLGSLAIAALLYWTVPRERGPRRALAFWLNPAVVLAAPVLGYQDTVFSALGLGAVLAMLHRRPVAATALVVAAGLVKPQGALLLPTLAVVLLREAGPGVWLRAAAAGGGVAALILAPWWSQGYLLSALDGCLRPLRQVTLAPLGFNVWWIAGWLMERAKDGPWPLAPIVGIGQFTAWAGWDPRWPARLLLLLATAGNLWLLLRALPTRRLAIPLSVLLQVHAYALLGTSVHENHTFLAVTLAPLLLGAWPRAPQALVGTSAFLFASLFFAAGLGRKVTRLGQIAALRLSLGLDLTVVLALAHIALVALLFVWAARCKIPADE